MRENSVCSVSRVANLSTNHSSCAFKTNLIVANDRWCVDFLKTVDGKCPLKIYS